MPDIKTGPTISIVVPFHNEEPNVVELYGRLQGVMEELGRSYQFVFVDDGSRDLTYKLLKELAEIDPHVVAVRLRRNFGQTAALAAGFAHSTGEYVIAMELKQNAINSDVLKKKIVEAMNLMVLRK